MSTGYSWEGIRQVRATLLGARHVPERLCGGRVYLGRYIKCSTFTSTFTFYCLTASFEVMWRHRSRDHMILHRAYVISYWWSFGTKSLSLTVSEIFNVKCNAMVDVTLIRPLRTERSRSFILVPIDFSYTTSYRLSISNFWIALGRTV